MLARHEFQIRCNCPVDGLPDCYDAVLETTGVVFVETVLEEIEKYKTLKMPQEQLTQELARVLGGTLTTVGNHSGVRLTVTAR